MKGKPRGWVLKSLAFPCVGGERLVVEETSERHEVRVVLHGNNGDQRGVRLTPDTFRALTAVNLVESVDRYSGTADTDLVCFDPPPPLNLEAAATALAPGERAADASDHEEL